MVELVVVQVIGFVEDECCFFYIDLHGKKITELINHTIGACHSHVEPIVFHFAKISFWSSYSKLKGQQNSIQCRKLRLNNCYLLASYFFLCIIPITYFFFILKIFLAFEFLDNG
jgi:hypothetical protein